jgi:E3 Ubiquitin ligase
MRTLIRNAPFGVFLAMMLLPLLMAAAAAVAGWRARRQATLITDTPASPIGMATDGYRELQGHVEAVDGQLLVAPLTGTPCCWYEARVEKWGRSMTTSKQFYWESVRSVTSSAPLLVRDATGTCAVHVFGAEITPTDRSQWTGATLEPEDRNPPRHGTAGAPTSVITVAGTSTSVYRYTEARIYAGDPLLVLGRFTNRRFDAPDLDEPPEEVVASDPGSSIDAWTATDRERADVLTARAAALTPLEIGVGEADEPLVISATSEGAHVAMAEMGSQAAFTIAVTLLAIVAFVLYTRLG